MSSSLNQQEEIIEIVDKNELNRQQSSRLIKLIDQFKRIYNNKQPDFVVCSNGRVNLIGDHIDYHGFAVLPMAIENSIWLACSFGPIKSPGDDSKSSISIYNSNSNTYAPWQGEHSFKYGHTLDQELKWQNYVLCGYHGVLANSILNVEAEKIYNHAREISSKAEVFNEQLKSLGDLQILIDSDLPPASGLSSSSALVCASAIATTLLLLRNQQHPQIEGRKLAHNCSKFEHLIGTHGGGMDQAIILTAQQGFAKYVEFLPELKCENVRLPNNTVWLVSHCGVSCCKAASSGYNARVLETKLAASMIAKLLPISNGVKLDKSITLSDIKRRAFDGKSSVADIVNILREKVFNHTNEFSVDEVCQKLELSRLQLIELFQTNEHFLINEMGDKLKLMSRCEHVLEEAERVERFKSICDTTIDVALLGQLMTQSHYSLRDKYECSHPALDRLVGVALDAGALGARLTGAGWGGCIVTLVEASKCETVYERLQEVSKFTFRTEPRTGSQIINLSS